MKIEVKSLPDMDTKRVLLAELVNTVHAETMKHAPAKLYGHTRSLVHETVKAVLGNLLVAFEDKVVGFQTCASNKKLGKTGTYADPILSQQHPRILRWMSETGFIYYDEGDNRHRPDEHHWEQNMFIRHEDRAPGVHRTAKLDETFVRLGLTTAHHTRRLPGQVLVILRTAKQVRKDDTNVAGDLVDYRQSALTKRLTAEMERINAAMYAHTYTYQGERRRPTALLRKYTCADKHKKVAGDTAFQSGGRLGGAEGRMPWWYPVNNADRITGTQIDGEPVADLDFVGAYVAFAYAACDSPRPAEGDLYDIRKVDPLHPYDDYIRSVVKRMYSACLFCRDEVSHWTWETQKELYGFQDKKRRMWVPPTHADYAGKTSPKRIVAALKQLHPDIVREFFRGRGHYYQNVESNILVAALLRLCDQNVGFLPMHDGLAVPRSKAVIAKAAMVEAFKEVTGAAWQPTIKSQARESLLAR
jgi:hypothetical protein